MTQNRFMTNNLMKPAMHAVWHVAGYRSIRSAFRATCKWIPAGMGKEVAS